jgi:hypothetical protein
VAIDTAAKRRNVNRMMRAGSMMGLAPSLGVDTADRVNAGRAYIGLTYQATPPPSLTRAASKMALHIGIRMAFIIFLGGLLK